MSSAETGRVWHQLSQALLPLGEEVHVAAGHGWAAARLQLVVAAVGEPLFPAEHVLQFANKPALC